MDLLLNIRLLLLIESLCPHSNPFYERVKDTRKHCCIYSNNTSPWKLANDLKLIGQIADSIVSYYGANSRAVVDAYIRRITDRGVGGYNQGGYMVRSLALAPTVSPSNGRKKRTKLSEPWRVSPEYYNVCKPTNIECMAMYVLRIDDDQNSFIVLDDIYTY